MTLAEFRWTYPTATFTVSSGKTFTYRYYQNPQAKATLVLLTGGIGLSDLFYKHFARFARDFSVLTFDYQLQFGDNGEFADAVAERATSIHITIIQAKSKQAQGLLKSLEKRTTAPIPIRCSAASAVPPLSAFPARLPHSGEGCHTPAPPAGLFDIPIAVRSFWR